MRCYYHRDVDAVATCRNCCRGLCEGCAADVNKMSACRGRCEADVTAVQALLARSDRAFTTAARQMRIAAFICLLFADWGSAPGHHVEALRQPEGPGVMR